PGRILPGILIPVRRRRRGPKRAHGTPRHDAGHPAPRSVHLRVARFGPGRLHLDVETLRRRGADSTLHAKRRHLSASLAIREEDGAERGTNIRTATPSQHEGTSVRRRKGRERPNPGPRPGRRRAVGRRPYPSFRRERDRLPDAALLRTLTLGCA